MLEIEAPLRDGHFTLIMPLEEEFSRQGLRMVRGIFRLRSIVATNAADGCRPGFPGRPGRATIEGDKISYLPSSDLAKLSDAEFMQ